MNPKYNNNTSISLSLMEPALNCLKTAFVILGTLLPSFAIAQQDSSMQLTAEKLFAPNHVTDIQIELDESDWDTIRTQKRSFSEALSKNRPEKPFTYAKGNVTIDGLLVKDVGIRKKGFLGSLNDSRPSLKIKFEEFTQQSPVDGLDRLTLNNNNQDSGRISQFLAYKLFGESGSHAPRCSFAKVTVNGKYLGIYTNVDAIKPDFLKYSFGNSKGALYEGTVTDFFPSFEGRFEKKNKYANTEYIAAVIDAFAKDELDLDEVGKLVDLDSFVKFWAMESLIGFWDGYCSNQNNFYLYRDSKSKKFYFIPWGIDSAFVESSPIPPFIIRPRSVHAKAILPNKLYRTPEVKSKYESTMKAMLDQHWNEKELIKEVDRLEAMLKPHVIEGNHKFASTLRSYRAFIKGRRAAILKDFKNGSPELASKEKLPLYFSEIGTVTATFSTQWFDQQPSDHKGVGDIDLNVMVNGKEVVLKDVGVFAKKDDRDASNASLMIMGTSSKSGKQIILVAVTPKTEWMVSDTAVGAGGVMIQTGMLGMIGAKMKMMFGTVHFDEASTVDGEPVTGKLFMNVGDFKSPDPEVEK